MLLILGLLTFLAISTISADVITPIERHKIPLARRYSTGEEAFILG